MKKSAVHFARLIAVVIALGFLSFYVLHAMGIVQIPSLRPRVSAAASSKNGVDSEPGPVTQWQIERAKSISSTTGTDPLTPYGKLTQNGDAEPTAATETPPESSEDKLIIMPSSKVGIMDFEGVFGPAKEEQPTEKEAPITVDPPETFGGSKSGVPIFPVKPPEPDPATVEIPAATPEPEPEPPPPTPPLPHTFGSSKALVPIIKPEPESKPAPEPEPETPQPPPAK